MDSSSSPFFELHPDPMWIFDAESLVILAVNTAAVETFGYSREALLQMTIADLRPQADRQHLRAKLAQAGTGRVAAGVWRLLHHDGYTLHIDITWHDFTWQGRPARLAALRDVSETERTRAENRQLLTREHSLRLEAQDTAALFEGIFFAVPGKFLVLRAGGHEIMAASDEYLRATQTCADDIRGRPVFDVFPPADHPDAQAGFKVLRDAFERVERGAASPVPEMIYYPIPRDGPDGVVYEPRYWSIINTPLENARGEVNYIINRVEDVTEFIASLLKDGRNLDEALETARRSSQPGMEIMLRTAELSAANRRLQRYETSFRTSQRLLSIGMWSLNLETGEIGWSENVFDMIGRSAADFRPCLRSLARILHPDDRRDTLARLRAVLNAPGARTLDLRARIRRPDGRTVHLHAVADLIESDSHRAMSGVIQDVTREITIARELDLSREIQRIAGRIGKMGGWQLDIRSRTVKWTDETAAIHETPRDWHPTLEQTLDFYVPEDRPRIAAAVEAAMTTGKPFDGEFRLRTAQGRLRWVRTAGQAERDADGRLSYLRGAFQDITDIRAAQAERDALDRRVVETLESISDSFFTLDRSWNFTYLNSQAEQILGRPRAELLGKNFWEEFPDAAQTAFYTEYLRAVAAGKTARFVEYFTPPGLWLMINAYPSSDGLAVYFRDVTQERADQQQLRMNEERFRLLASAARDVVWDWDVVNNTIWWNDAVEKVFGHDPKVLAAAPENWLQYIHAQDRDWVCAQLRVLGAELGTEWSADFRLLHADGHVVHVHGRAFVIRSDTGNVIRVLGNLADITERRVAEARERQSQKMEAIGQLTGGVAHDFNNLLTIILGNAELLIERLEALGEEPLRQMAAVTETAAQRGAELTSRLLSFSRQQALTPQPVDLNGLVSATDGMLRRTLAGNIEIALFRCEDLWITELDPGQFEIALLNLAFNARDAMPEGGRITIETANLHLSDSNIGGEEGLAAGDYVCLTFSDTGVGMTPEVVERAFEPFFTTKHADKGSGLGLSMVYGFVRQSGGHLRIYSEPGQGSAFKLYFPRMTHPRRQVASETPALPGTADSNADLVVPGGTERLLVVEDDPLVRGHVLGLLEELGYRPTGASSGPEALKALETAAPYDLLFTDVVMPGGMNGRQLAEAAQVLRPELRVLFMSGYTENAIAHHGRLPAGVHLLSKPFRKQELARKLRQVLDA